MKIAKFVVTALIIGGIVLSCSTLPVLAKTSPEIFEDNNVKIEYIIGVNVYYIVIENKSTAEIYIDSTRASVISIKEESRSLNLQALDNHIPPNSKVVYASNQSAFFDKDVYEEFMTPVVSNKMPGPKEQQGSLINSKSIVTSMIGQSIRLYIPIIIYGEEKIYDIIVKIIDIKNI